MKILGVLDADWFVKGPHQYHHLLEILSSRGHEIVITDFENYWHLVDEGRFKSREKFEGVSRFYKNANITVYRPGFIRLPMLDYVSYLFYSRGEIKKLINDFKPDIVIAFTAILSAYWGMRYARKNNIPYIYYWLDVNHELIPFNLVRPIAKVIEKEIIKNSTAIMAINKALMEYMVNLGNNGGNTYVIPGGVDFNHFDPLKVDPNVMREKYYLSKDDLVLFYMGWIYEFSGLEEVIRDILEIKDLHPYLKLMIVGEGDNYSRLKGIVDDTGAEDRIILTGKRPYEEMPYLVAASDICLLPAQNNNVMRNIVPIKIYEYLAMHKPVISTKLPGVLKEFGHNNGVIYVESPDFVVNNVISLTGEDIKKNQLKAKDFIKDYNWDNIVNKFEKIIELVHELNSRIEGDRYVQSVHK